MMPKPPAWLTAAASLPPAMPPIGARMIGWVMLSRRVSAVAIAMMSLASRLDRAPSICAALRSPRHATFNSHLFRRHQLARNVGDAFRDVMAERLNRRTAPARPVHDAE